MNKLKLLDLFSGIGGFSLGLESTGFFETIAFVEKDKFCRKVLKKNFNNIPIEEDRCKLIWKSKVSKSNVLLFQLQASVLGIKEKESGLLDSMLPTPTTMDHIDRKGMRPSRAATNRKTGYLSEMIKMYPTPTSVQRPNEGNMRMMRKQVLQGNISREDATAMVGKDIFKAHGKVRMYPTPTASCQMDVVAPPETVLQNSKGWTVTRKKTGTKFGAKLNDVVNKINNKPGGKLSPNFVEFLMGYPLNWTKIDPTE
jgi:hypothetical protein